MKKLLLILSLISFIGCGSNETKLPDLSDEVAANTALIELNSSLDALLATRVSSLESRMSAVESDISSLQSELASLSDDVEGNAEAIEELQSKLKKAIAKQRRINAVNNIKFSSLYRSISHIQGQIKSLVKQDKKLKEKLERLTKTVRSLQNDLAKNTQLDLKRLQLVLSKFKAISTELAALKDSAVTVMSCNGNPVLKTKYGFLVASLDGYEMDVVVESGQSCDYDWYWYWDYPFFGDFEDYYYCNDNEDDYETEEIFVATEVNFEFSEEFSCQGDR